MTKGALIYAIGSALGLILGGMYGIVDGTKLGEDDDALDAVIEEYMKARDDG